MQPVGGQHCPPLSQSLASPLGNHKLPQKGPPLVGWFGYFGGSAHSQEQLCFFFKRNKSHFYVEDTWHLPYISGCSLTSFPLQFTKGTPACASLELACKSDNACALFSRERCFVWLKPKALFTYFFFVLS